MEKLNNNRSHRGARAFIRSGEIALIIAAIAAICRPVSPMATELNGVAVYLQPQPADRAAASHASIICDLPKTLSLAYEALSRCELPLAVNAKAEAKQGLAIVRQSNASLNSSCASVLGAFGPARSHMILQASKSSDEETRPPEGEAQGNSQVLTTLSLQENFRVYLVRQGDSLWTIARRFDMNHLTLARINGLRSGAFLQVGRPLKIKVFSSRKLRLNLTSATLANHPSLLEQIRLIDGRPVPRWLVTDYVADIIDRRFSEDEETNRKDGKRRHTIVIDFQLVKNLLEGRARQYQSIVLDHAEKYDLDPALIMAMIHTESAFNPKARSKASAYGLMQLVPHTAAAEAYYRVYGQRRALTPQYLYDPNNNIELGAAYLHILKRGYLASISDPLSRTYLAVAAYHAGPSSVGRAFIPNASLKQAAPVINSLKPSEVYERLVEALPAMESRTYVRKVMTRFKKYRGWYSKSRATQT